MGRADVAGCRNGGRGASCERRGGVVARGRDRLSARAGCAPRPRPTSSCCRLWPGTSSSLATRWRARCYQLHRLGRPVRRRGRSWDWTNYRDIFFDDRVSSRADEQRDLDGRQPVGAGHDRAAAGGGAQYDGPGPQHPPRDLFLCPASCRSSPSAWFGRGSTTRSSASSTSSCG